MGAKNELTVALLTQLFSEPLHLTIAAVAGFEVIGLRTIKVHGVHRQEGNFRRQVDPIVAAPHKSRIDFVQRSLIKVLRIAGQEAEPHIVHIVVKELDGADGRGVVMELIIIVAEGW